MKDENWGISKVLNALPNCVVQLLTIEPGKVSPRKTNTSDDTVHLHVVKGKVQLKTKYLTWTEQIELQELCSEFEIKKDVTYECINDYSNTCYIIEIRHRD